jgi:hypothetical protein
MGRPLKIAKAQAVVTLTATNGTTEVVTTNANFTNLGIIAGMPFIPASTVGNLVGGTTYWILSVVNSGNNSTFTVSATPLNANPTNTAFNLGTTSAQTVALTIGLVDSGFNNPDGSNTATNSTSYGAVGGNTSIYGSQTLVRVAIGQTGTGTIYTNSANANVFGVGTDFTGELSAGSALQVAVANPNGTTDYVNLGFVTSSVAGLANIELSNATATGNFLTSVGNAQTLFASQPVVLTADIGGLTAGTTYFVKTIANAAAFSVSLTAGGANVALTNDDAESYALQDRVILTGSASTTATNAAFIYADDEAGYIVRQKGKTKYLVTSATGLTAQCFTVNAANAALTPNTMNILATYDDSSTKYVSALNDYNSEVFPTTVAAGSLVAGTAYTIYSTGTTNWALVGSASSMTGVTFIATGAGSGTGTAIVNSVNPDVIATFGTAYAANTYGGQPNPIVTINNA